MDNTMKPTLGCTRTTAQTLALYLVLCLSLYAAVPAQTQDIRWQQTGDPSWGDIRCFANNGTTIFVGTEGFGIYRSSDNGSNWIQMNAGLTNPYVRTLAISSNGLIFAGVAGGGVYLSSDNGVNWTRLNFQPNYSVNALTVSSTGLLIAGTGGGVYRSSDNGANWVSVNSGIPTIIVYALTMSTNGTLFAGASDGGVFRSSDNGMNWTMVKLGIPNNFPVYAITASRNGTLFAGTDSGIFRSSDNGTNWTSVNTGLINSAVRAFTVSSNGTLFAGILGGGVFRSSDNGTSWTSVNTGLINFNVSALTICDNNTLFAGTNTWVFKTDISNISMVSVRTSAPQPSSASISFAPHPVFDCTRLTLDIPRACMVEVRIFDVLGRLVQHTALGEIPAGTHDIEQDLHTLPNGTYSVVVQAGSERVAKLLQVLR